MNHALHDKIDGFRAACDEFFQRAGMAGPQPVGYSARTLERMRKSEKPVDTNPYLQSNLFELDLPARSHKYFRYLKITTVRELLKYSAADLIGLRNMGVRTVKAIQRELKANGYSLRRY